MPKRLGHPNIYRTGYGFQLGEKRLQALAAYQQLVHNSRCQRNRHRSTTVGKYGKDKRCLIYLDQVISRFPNQAGEALVEKAEILDTSRVSQLLSAYCYQPSNGNSEAAAEYRWKVALAKAAAKDYQAWNGRSHPTHNPKSILAPRAGF